ncbi:MAG: acetate/propionate family kinase [Prolixibacteraceae bacterium]|nr:acetate/propionate family kinase [Prolixibacteraceae bacterium]
MNVLIINCGSSSIKFHLYRMPEESVILHGKAEKSGSGNSVFSFVTSDQRYKEITEGFFYGKNIEIILTALTNPEISCLSSLSEINMVGYRLIHSPEPGVRCMQVTDEVVKFMESSVPLAPLHYPAYLEVFKKIGEMIPGVFQGGVFDSSFYDSLPLKARLYGIPLRWFREYNIRRYGFHGISHQYAAMRACELTGTDYYKSRVISCHLGNGSSLAAVRNGEAVDTSMGMTPVEGLLMGTRSGDIDAGVILYLQQNYNLSPDDIQRIINIEGGLLGLSEVSSDYRLVEKAAREGNEKAKSALDVFLYRIKKYIGAYAAAMEGLDVLVFTGGIGENSEDAREVVCEGMEFIGISLSKELNSLMNGCEAVISRKDSQTRIVIIPANEELVIAREIYALGIL